MATQEEIDRYNKMRAKRLESWDTALRTRIDIKRALDAIDESNPSRNFEDELAEFGKAAMSHASSELARLMAEGEKEIVSAKHAAAEAARRQRTGDE